MSEGGSEHDSEGLQAHEKSGDDNKSLGGSKKSSNCKNDLNENKVPKIDTNKIPDNDEPLYIAESPHVPVVIAPNLNSSDMESPSCESSEPSVSPDMSDYAFGDLSIKNNEEYDELPSVQIDTTTPMERFISSSEEGTYSTTATFNGTFEQRRLYGSNSSSTGNQSRTFPTTEKIPTGNEEMSGVITTMIEQKNDKVKMSLPRSPQPRESVCCLLI